MWSTMRDIRTWDTDVRAGDLLKVYERMSQVVKAWPFDGDPAKPESYDNLTPQQYGQVFSAVRDAATHFFLVALGGAQ